MIKISLDSLITPEILPEHIFFEISTKKIINFRELVLDRDKGSVYAYTRYRS